MQISVARWLGASSSWLATHKDAVTAVGIVTWLGVVVATVSVLIAALTFRFNARNERLRWKANVTAVWMDSSLNRFTPSMDASLKMGTPTMTILDSSGRVVESSADVMSSAPLPPPVPPSPPRNENNSVYTLLIRNLSFRPTSIVDIAVYREDGQRTDPKKYRDAIGLPLSIRPWGVRQLKLKIDHHDAGPGPYTLKLRDLDFNVILVDRVPDFVR